MAYQVKVIHDHHTGTNRPSTWLELFFDLCFVVAVAALARGLHDDPTLGGTLRFVVRSSACCSSVKVRRFCGRLKGEGVFAAPTATPPPRCGADRPS
ncbi:MAG: low temperature requirement protein A [Rubrobacter sp.]|nr:low temperature requirement protein A [Rubrobacter sp.]